MPRTNTAIDPPHTQQWIEPIGKFVLNFAAIELECYLWLSVMLRDPQRVSSMIATPFKSRVDILLERIDGLSGHHHEYHAYREAWGRALEIAKRRNVLVHNPIVYGWSTADHSGPPDVIGIPDLNHLGTRIVTTAPMLTLRELTGLVNATSELAQTLHALRQGLEQ